MNIEALRLARLGAVIAPLALAACTPMDQGFGSSVKTNIAAQTVNPDASYGEPLASADGSKASAAVERYRTDKVKAPKGIRTTNVGTGGGSSSSGSSSN